MKISCKNKRGFTLIELLVVVIIIGVLSAIAIPGYMRSVEKTKASIAMQALSDIAKAEHDYYAAQSKYTNDFGDLTITMTDENTMDEAEYSSYATKHYIFNLDNNQELATAKRLGGDAPYTLYRLFDDPRIYCQPAGNKYCEMLDLPAGRFTHSVGAWQSCPGGVYPCSMSCSRSTTSGYSCYGTYNEDGTFREKVCDSNGLCLTTQYNADQKGLRQNICYSYDEDGNCTGGGESMYDENGNLLSYHGCTAWAEDGTCTAGTSGSVYTYDANGNQTSSRYCTSWNSNGTCATYGTSGSLYTYDANGNQTSSRSCTSWNSNGTCATYGSGSVYTYDANGNKTSDAYCSSWNSNGTCATYGSSSVYTYDANGNKTSSRSCTSWNSNGTCATYGTSGSVYTYDANGNMTSESSLDCWNDECTDGTRLTFTYAYDESGNKIYRQYSNKMFFGSNEYTWGEDRNCYYTLPNGTQEYYSC